MRSNQNGFITKFLGNLSYLIDIIIIGILLAFAIELLANCITIHLTKLQILIIGVIVFILIILYLIKRLINIRGRAIFLKGFFVYHIKKNEIIDVPHYHYGSQLQKILFDGFSFNQNLKSNWMKNSQKGISSKEIIINATEYYVLKELSNQLRENFANYKFQEKRLQKYQGEDIDSHILLNNPFMLLFFSKTYEDLKHTKFDLILPKETKLCSLGEKGIKIETKRMCINFLIKFEHNKTILPDEFEEIYLRIHDENEIIAFEIRLDISIKFKINSFLSGSGWDYYRWVDVFFNELDVKFSSTSFFEKINWENTLTIIKGHINYKEYLDFQERKRIKTLKDNRGKYLENKRLISWLRKLHEHHEKHGIKNNLPSCIIGKEEKIVPFLIKSEWDVPHELDELPIINIEQEDKIVRYNDILIDFPIDYGLINDRKLMSQRIWDSPTIYLDFIAGGSISIELHLKKCRYFASATSMIELENETIDGVKSGSCENCEIRKKYYLKTDCELYKPMTLGCMIVFALKAEEGYDVILQIRSKKNVTGNSVTSIAPTFGLSPFRGKPPKNKLSHLYYNFIKEYLEELHGSDNLAKDFLTKRPKEKFYDWIYGHEEARRLIDNPNFKLYYIGFGFNLINGYPNIGLLAKLDNETDSDIIKKAIKPNWEIAEPSDETDFEDTIFFINTKTTELDEKFAQDEFDPASSYFLSTALRYLR